MAKKTAKALIEELDARGIYNTFRFAGAHNVWIDYVAATGGLSAMYAYWGVVQPRLKTETFTVTGRERKAPQLQAAKEWASARYGVAEWVKTPYGTWMDAAVYAARLAELGVSEDAPKKTRQEA